MQDAEDVLVVPVEMLTILRIKNLESRIWSVVASSAIPTLIWPRDPPTPTVTAGPSPPMLLRDVHGIEAARSELRNASPDDDSCIKLEKRAAFSGCFNALWIQADIVAGLLNGLSGSGNDC